MTLVSRLKTTGPAIAMGAAAATTVLAILGIAGTVMSMHCNSDATACGAPPTAVEATIAAPADKDQERLDTALPPTPAAPVASTGPGQVIAIARNDMIIGTFDMLTQPLVLTETPAQPGDQEAVEAVAASTRPEVDLPMATAEAPDLVARRAPVDVGSSEAAKAIDRELGGGVAAETTLAYAPAAAKPAGQPAKPAAKAETSADLRTVGGTGVNVRSGPAKSSKKLFALAGGAQVTVKEDRGGWLRVVDARGRSGWAYKSFLSP